VTAHTSLPSHKYAAQLQLQKKTQDTQDTATLLYLLCNTFKKKATTSQQHLRNGLNKGKGAQQQGVKVKIGKKALARKLLGAGESALVSAKMDL